MKRNKNILFKISCLVCISLIYISCNKYEAPVASMTPIDIGGIPDTYASLAENTDLQIPINFTTPCDSGLLSASYKVVNNRASDVNLVVSPAISIPISGKSVNTTITVPVRTGLMSVVISIYDKASKLSYKSITIKSVTPSDANVKTLTNVVMSTDPADNQCFFSFYEANPVFGQTDALTKQERVDFVMINMGGAKPITCHAYAASIDYYNISKTYLAGFTTLSYNFISASQTYIGKDAFDAIVKESDLTNFLNLTVIGAAPVGNNYNIINRDRRVGEAFNETSINKGFIVGWGYHTSPTATATSVLNQSFALVMVKSVTKKANGHYTVTFDVKAPATDQRAAFTTSSVAPYIPYPL